MTQIEMIYSQPQKGKEHFLTIEEFVFLKKIKCAMH